jgi:Skp family chaperone for outer membrane proteins
VTISNGLKRKGEDYEALVQKRLAEVSQPFNEKILKSLKSYCKQHGIAIVFELGAADQAGVHIWHTPAADITDDFMEEYNKANPAVASSPVGAKKN